MLFAAYNDTEPNGSFTQYQPLNIGAQDTSTTLTVNGSISSLSDVDYYAFYVKQGDPISVNCRAAVTTGDLRTEFDPTIGLFSPSGGLLQADDDGGTGSIWAAGLAYTAPADGIYRLAVSHFNDLTTFDGSNSRPSYDPSNPEATGGPGVHTGGYVLSIVGADRPEVVVDSPGNISEFHIPGDDPQMPTITLQVKGIVPPPNATLTYNWDTQVKYRASDYGAGGGRGSGRDQSTSYSPHTTTNGVDTFTPDFKIGDTVAIRGGYLAETVTATVNGQDVQAKTLESLDKQIKILGDNPSPQAIRSYIVNSITAPTSWPSGYAFNFKTTLRKMISKESSVQQFVGGVPKWSQDNLGGAGLMQITPRGGTGAPPEQCWDWRKNVAAGAQRLRSGLDSAAQFFSATLTRNKAAFDALKGQYHLSSIVLGTTATDGASRGTMLARNAIRSYNGLGPEGFYEYRSAKGADGKFLLNIVGNVGTTVWERVPVTDRPNNPGDKNYVVDVEGSADF